MGCRPILAHPNRLRRVPPRRSPALLRRNPWGFKSREATSQLRSIQYCPRTKESVAARDHLNLPRGDPRVLPVAGPIRDDFHHLADAPPGSFIPEPPTTAPDGKSPGSRRNRGPAGGDLREVSEPIWQSGREPDGNSSTWSTWAPGSPVANWHFTWTPSRGRPSSAAATPPTAAPDRRRGRRNRPPGRGGSCAARPPPRSRADPLPQGEVGTLRPSRGTPASARRRRRPTRRCPGGHRWGWRVAGRQGGCAQSATSSMKRGQRGERPAREEKASTSLPCGAQANSPGPLPGPRGRSRLPHEVHEGRTAGAGYSMDNSAVRWNGT